MRDLVLNEIENVSGGEDTRMPTVTVVGYRRRPRTWQGENSLMGGGFNNNSLEVQHLTQADQFEDSFTGGYDPSPDDHVFGLEIIENPDGTFTWTPELPGYFDLNLNNIMDGIEELQTPGQGPTTSVNTWENRQEAWDTLAKYTIQPSEFWGS